MNPSSDTSQQLTSLQQVEKILGNGGVFSQQIKQFKAREEQIELTTNIIDCLNNNRDLLAEAGTGIGKTFAYLVAIIVTGKKAIISTGTKNLQDQLFEKDIPTVLNILKSDRIVRLLKGRNNYICLHRYEKSRFLPLSRLNENKVILKQIEHWLNHTKNGEISELDIPHINSQLHANLTSTPENCLGTDCEHYTDCFIYRARRRAMNADLLVVNHHLLFADMALKSSGFGEVLPQAEAIIIDESHQLPEIAGHFLSQAFSSRQCQELLRDLGSDASLETGATATVSDQIQWVQQALRDCFMQLHNVPAKGGLNELRQNTKVSEILDLLHASLTDLEQSAAVIAAQSKGLESCHQRISMLLELLSELLNGEDEEAIYWYESRSKYFSLNKSPLDVSTALDSYRNEINCPWILTSATLTVNNEFDHYQKQTGFLTADKLLLNSPFDYKKQGLLLMPKNLPEPNSQLFNQTIFEYTLPIIETVAGGVFFLFTSHRSLQQAADFFSVHLKRPLFIQGKQQRSQMLDEFRTCKNGVLLGAASFWEGVDVAGDSLSCVIIDRLPFAHPNDPVLQARINHIRKQGGNPFFDYQIPKAAIGLKQGAGRLIRGETDYGLLVICDQRMISKNYGAIFQRSLPDMSVTYDRQVAIDFLSQSNKQPS